MTRRPGLSARVKLAASYAGFLMVAAALLLAVVWLFLLRYVPDTWSVPSTGLSSYSPSRSDLVRAFLPAAGWALAALFVFGVVGGWVLAGWMLAPLARITAATRRVARGDLSHRIELEGRGDEFRELADSFDEMLARVQSQIEEQQRFAANASHELRTPLAITQTLLDVAISDPERDTDELLGRLQSVNTRAIDLTEALLLLTKADQRAFTPERVELSLLVDDAVETLLPLAERDDVDIEVSGEMAWTAGSEALLRQLTVNLLHNAIAHNVEGGTVWIVTQATPTETSITIENTGEVLDAHRLNTLTEPFRRGTDRIRSDHAGVGLGLAIAQSITRAHDGTLTLTARPDGGLRVVVQLPAVV